MVATPLRRETQGQRYRNDIDFKCRRERFPEENMIGAVIRSKAYFLQRQRLMAKINLQGYRVRLVILLLDAAIIETQLDLGFSLQETVTHSFPSLPPSYCQLLNL